MSSLKSHVPPTKASLVLRDAFVEVCENSFFAYVEPCEPQRFADLVTEIGRATASGSGRANPKGQSVWLRATVAFQGAFAGGFEVVLPETLARSLVMSLLGEAPESELGEHQVFDGIGEFANMVCGAWLTNLNEKDAFELRGPVVTRMASDWTPLSDTGWRDESWHLLSVNDLPIRVRFRQAVDRA